MNAQASLGQVPSAPNHHCSSPNLPAHRAWPHLLHSLALLSLVVAQDDQHALLQSCWRHMKGAMDGGQLKVLLLDRLGPPAHARVVPVLDIPPGAAVLCWLCFPLDGAKAAAPLVAVVAVVPHGCPHAPVLFFCLQPRLTLAGWRCGLGPYFNQGPPCCRCRMEARHAWM